ncbi:MULTISPECIES: DUF3761 domain-containing protein [Rhodococcus]|uniref:DUF3761 domain-containing protein n=1 Tax=Rhodococcus TaxID=1827 RepID=UPI001C20BE5E|nr:MULTISPECIES: DUF3761 domain-containing protein [Rhodococcus]WAL47931.1 DUF3761 domain-containing protein [Rhodococcus pyridinivorans]
MAVFGLLAIAAGVMYLREDRTRPARYKWAAWALIPGFILAGATAPEPEREPETPAAEQTSAIAAPVSSSTSTTTTPPPEPLPAPASFELVDSDRATQALKTLATIRVRDEAPAAQFDLTRFGEEWSDDVAVDGGHNGCDTRNDILRRDLTAVSLDPQSACTVRTGTLEDVYTGDSVVFDDVVIDHVVSLSDAWQKGAYELGAETLRDLANDPRNLQAVAQSVSTEKSDRDASAWLPPNEGYRCTYAARQVEVKAAYQLWTTITEHQALKRELISCGGIAPTPTPTTTEPAPTTEQYTPPPAAAFVAPPPPVEIEPAPAPPPAPAPAPAPAPDSGYSGGCGANSYVNVNGNCIPGPVQAPTAPAGASARCADGTYSFSQNRRGTCSGHGGVDEWL